MNIKKILKSEYRSRFPKSERLGKVAKLVNWEAFRPMLEPLFKNTGGRPHTDVVLMTDNAEPKPTCFSGRLARRTLNSRSDTHIPPCLAKNDASASEEGESDKKDEDGKPSEHGSIGGLPDHGVKLQGKGGHAEQQQQKGSCQASQEASSSVRMAPHLSSVGQEPLAVYGREDVRKVLVLQ